MNLKKFAVRGIVSLAIFVALCMFFSGTVRTITTPKVRLTSARRGKLEQRIELNCKVAYPQTESVTYTAQDDTSLVIVKVNTREGYTAQAGDVVIEAKLSGYEQQRKQFQENYDAASEQLLALENKNRGIRVTQRDTDYADAYFALRDARRETVRLKLETESQLSREGLEMPGDGYPDGASDDLVKLIDDWRAAALAEQAAQEVMDRATRHSVDETVWTYITEQREQQEKLAEAEEGLKKLVALNDSVKAITAPHDGYIAELCVKEGESCENGQALFKLTPEDTLPVLRADLTDVTRSVTEGMTVSLNPDSYDAIETQIVDVGTDAEGKKYADIELTDALIRAKGSVYTMAQGETALTLIYRAREATSLITTSAVRGSGDDRYVFIADQNTSAFGGGTLKLSKMGVKVLGEYGGTTSVQEDITYYSIVYGEDRDIKEGDAVMEYINNAG